MRSPYAGKSFDRWPSTTEWLLSHFPLAMPQLVEVVLNSWEDIFKSRIGRDAYRIGRDIWPEPQIMGFLLHELIPLNLTVAEPTRWKRGAASRECDAHHIPNDDFSFEIKTSSSAGGIFGNRSYTQVSPTAAKRRAGYMLAVNFDKFSDPKIRPAINLIRFGWLGPGDWIGQKAESGQQARLTKEAKAYKLKVLYEISK